MGGVPLAKNFDHFGGLSPPSTSCIGLASKVFSTAVINYALLRGY